MINPYFGAIHYDIYLDMKKKSPESIRTIAQNPNIDLKSIGFFSKSNKKHHFRTQQFQELLTKTDKLQRQSIDQNLRKLATTAAFSDIYQQGCSGYFKDFRDYICLNWEKTRPQNILLVNIFLFHKYQKQTPSFSTMALIHIECKNYFIGFLFYFFKGNYNPCVKHTQVNRQASVARILFEWPFE